MRLDQALFLSTLQLVVPEIDHLGQVSTALQSSDCLLNGVLLSGPKTGPYAIAWRIESVIRLLSRC